MLLTVSIGNTNTAFGIFEEGELRRHGRAPNRDLVALPAAVGDVAVAEIALASVAPSRTGQAVSILASAFNRPVLIAGRDLPFTMDIQCREPASVGADRLLNAVAAFHHTGTACVVVDAGTAITVDLVSEKGSFCGGAIAPGPATMLRALAAEAEQLPDVPFQRPPGPLGRDTVQALQSGAWYGAIGLVRELVTRICRERTGLLPVLVTGGAGEFIAAELTPPVEYLPHLTLEGIACLVARTRGRA